MCLLCISNNGTFRHSPFLSILSSLAILDGVQSEISLIHPDDINWFLTCDETHHAFSNEGNKDGNCRVVLETLRRTKEQQEKEKEEKERARKVAEDGKLNSGLEAFGKWCGDGSKVDDHNHPIMSRMSALAIVKVLMPKVEACRLYNIENLHEVAW